MNEIISAKKLFCYLNTIVKIINYEFFVANIMKMLLNMYENSIYMHFHLFSIYSTFSLGSGKGKTVYATRTTNFLKHTKI